MKYTYSLGQRLVAHTLLLSLLLQSCLNPSVPLPQIQVDKTQEISQKPIIKTKTNKFQASLGIQESTSSTSNQVIQLGLYSDLRDDSMSTSSRNNLSHIISAPVGLYSDLRDDSMPNSSRNNLSHIISAPVGLYGDLRDDSMPNSSRNNLSHIISAPVGLYSDLRDDSMPNSSRNNLSHIISAPVGLYGDLRDDSMPNSSRNNLSHIISAPVGLYSDLRDDSMLNSSRNNLFHITSAPANGTLGSYTQQRIKVQPKRVSPLSQLGPKRTYTHETQSTRQANQLATQPQHKTSKHPSKKVDKTPIHRLVQEDLPEQDPIVSHELQASATPLFIEETPFYAAQGGYQVKFMRNEQGWLAFVQDTFSDVFHRNFYLPVYQQGISIKGLDNHTPLWLKHHIHVCPPEKDTKSGKGHVYIGNQGLLGGVKTPLHEAIEQGDVGDKKYGGAISLIHHYPKYLSEQDEQGATPLHLAVCCVIRNKRYEMSQSLPHEDLIQAMISKGAHVNATDNNKRTPLHWAVDRYKQTPLKWAFDMYRKSSYDSYTTRIEPNYPTIIKQLVKLGAHVNAQDKDGYTPLDLAVKKGSFILADLLLELGADINIKGKHNVDANLLHWASCPGSLQTIEWLIKRGIDIHAKDSRGFTCLCHPAIWGLTEVVRPLVQAGVRVNDSDKGGLTPLHWAIRNGKLDMAQELVKYGANIYAKDNYGGSCLHYAITDYKPNLKLIRWLVSQGLSVKDPNKNGQTPIHIALKDEDKLLSQQLLNALGVNSDIHAADRNGRTWLHRAVVEGDQETTKLLIKSGVDKNPKDKAGNTPLYLALEKGNVEMVRQLVNCQVEVDKNIQTSTGWKLLQLIAAHKNSILSKQLLSILGIDIADKDQRGYTPLHHAVLRNNTQLIELLIGLQVDIKSQDNQGNTPLHLAVEYCKADIVRQLITAGADINAGDRDGKTALCMAITRDNIGMVELLIRSGVAINAKDNEGNTPLHLAMAMKKCNERILQWLVGHQADIHAKNNVGYTPLHLAVLKGNPYSVHLLLDLGVAINAKDDEGYTPIHLGAAKGHDRICIQLVEAKASLHQPNTQGLTPVEVAAQSNHWELLQQVFQSGADINELGEDGLTHLHRAVDRGNIELVDQLLKLGAEVDAKDKEGNTPLHLGTAKGHSEISIKLVQAQASLHQPNSQGLTPVEVAAQSNYWELLQQVFQSGADINELGEDGLTHLHRAVDRGNIELVDQLLRLGVEVDAKDQEGNTPLHLGTAKGHSEISIKLVQAQASLHQPNSQGLTPVEVAAQSNYWELLQQVFQSNADINELGEDELTHLHRAVDRGNIELVDQLLKLGTEVDAKDQEGNTPLHLGTAKGHSEISIKLVQAQASLHQPNSQGLTPVEVAAQSNHWELLQQVFQSGADIDELGEDGLSHLHKASQQGSEELVKWLTKLEANINLPSQQGDTALHLASSQGHTTTTIALLTAGSNIHAKNQEGLSPLETAYKADKAAVVQAMLQTMDVNNRDQEGFSHLYKALQHELPGLAQPLIRTGADINGTNEEGWTDLHLAAKHGHVEVVKQLLELKANPLVKDKRGNIPLHIALQYKQYEIVALLIQQAFDPATTQEQTDAFLQEAFKAHHADLVTKVIKSGSYVDGRDEKWMTHFHRAIQQGNVQVARRLKELGADIHAKNKKGENALHLAMRAGNIALAKWLMEQGICYQVSDYSGHTPFYTALKNNQLGLVEQLMKTGMDIDARDQAGRTALHQAIREGDINMVQRLIALGANVHVADQCGVSPLQMVLQRNHQKIVRLLVQASFSSKKKEQTIPSEKLDKRIRKHVEAVLQLKTNSPTTAPSPTAIAGFHEAVRKNDLSLVERLVEAGLPIDCTNEKGENAMHIAVQAQHADLAVWLLQRRINASVRDQSGKSPLYHVLKQGNMELAKKLVKAGLPLEDDTHLRPGFTTLHEAVKQGDINVVNRLLALGAPVVSKEGKPKTMPLHVAAQYGHVEIAQILSQAGADWHQQDQAGLTPLQVAAKAGQYEFIKRVLQQRMISINQPSQEGMTHLHQAMLQGDVKLVKALLQAGAEVDKKNQEGKTALHLAAQQRRLELVETLIKGGANLHEPDHQGWTPLHTAIYNGHLTVAKRLVKALLQTGAEVDKKNQEGKTALHLAAQQGHLELVEILIKGGANPHEPDQQGWRPLHAAVYNGHLTVAKRLVELGSDLRAKTPEGCHMLHLATQQGHEQVVEWLLGQGIDVHASNLEGQTSLHIAAAKGHLGIVITLLYQGASVHLQDQQGNTPLHLSAQHGHTQVSNTLVQEGASVTVLDHRKRSPLFVAIQQGHFDLVYQSSSVYTSQQHTQHTNHPIVLQEASSSQPTRSGVSLQTFLEEYPATLLPEQVEPFSKLVAPLLIERLSTEDVRLQEKIIHYLQEGGQLYPGVLKNCPVSDWIQESLLLDIGREALLQGNELLFQQLQEQIQILSKHAKPGATERILLILQQKRLTEPLQPDTLLEVLQFASVLPMPLALEMLTINNFNWQLSWKYAWLYEQLPGVCLGHRPKDILQHSLLHLPWSPAITSRFLEGIQGEQALASIDDFLCFVSKYEVPESTLMMAMHQPPFYATLNQLQAWKHYIACELLKNKLVSVFPGHVKPLYDKLAFLLGHGCAYESIDSLLTHLQASSQSSSSHDLAAQQAQHLLEALDLLKEYRPSVDVCERVWKLLEAEKDLSSQNQSIDHTIHQTVINATFLDAHERSIEEINGYIAAKAAGVHFVGDVKALEKAYQEVEDTYHRSSSILSSATPIKDWNRQQVTNATPIKDWNRQQVTEWAAHVRERVAKGNIQSIRQVELVAVVKHAVYLQYKYHPRGPQLMSLMAFLNHAPEKGRLLQINTGEGKSLIVAMLATIFALQGRKVDVVTSSTELSIPEVAKQQDFFAMFGLTVGENSRYEAKKEVYQRDIVYGTAGDFQGDILRTEFSGEDIRGDRGFGVVIVDEVDNLLFDSRNTSVMLSSPTAGMHHLELVLASAWSYVSILARHLIEKGGKTYFITEKFQVEGNQIKLFSNNPLEACMFEVKDREAFLQEKTEEHLRKLLRDLSYEERRERESLQAIQERITLLGQEISTLQTPKREKEKREKEQLCERLQEEITQTAWKKNQRDEIIEIPNHLKDFARHQIPYWTQHAIGALWYQKEVHYDVQNDKIVPIDYANTGVLQTNMVWSDGLAQMLQIKEGLRLEPENISNNFISNAGYFKRYGPANIYGMTGTLGGQQLQQFFEKIYGVDVAIIPPYKVRSIHGNESSKYLCKELPAIVAHTPAEWQEAVVETILQKTKHSRGVLVLCEFIEQVKQFEKLLCEKYDGDKIFTYTGQVAFHKKDVQAGEIILATNISGRGNDFITKELIEQNGGMHVCMTFLPTNDQVERQNAGRTAREGKKGTAQLVLYDPDPTHTIEYLRARRDTQVDQEIKVAMEDVEEMLFRDHLFTKFCALENEFFPSASEQAKIEQSRVLASTWEKIAKKNLSLESIAAAYQAKILEQMRAKLLERQKNPSGEISATVLTSVGEQAKKELPEVAFKKQYEQKLLNEFCQATKAYVSPDVLVSFQERKSYTPTHASYAVTRDWGRYERKALEERWGFWLHKILHQRHTFTKEKILQRFNEFASQISSDAYAGRLVQNPYFYLLKGNNYLGCNDHERAVDAYNQAIYLDPIFSVNARYNKVRALLSEKDNKKHHATVKEELEKSLILIANSHKPTVLSIHSMTGMGDPKPKLAEHLQHQVNILGSQENHIMAALGVVKKALRKDWEIKRIKKKYLKDLTEVFRDEPVSHEYAIDKAETNGLRQLFTITEKKPTPWWSICTVALIGLAQIATGTILMALTGGLGAQLGTKFISDGISDLVTAAKAAWSGKFSWAEWGLQKAISWTVTILTIGFSKVCETFKKVAESLGILNEGFGQKGIGLAMQHVGLELGKTVAKECINGLVDYGLSKVVLDDIEKEITRRVSQKITAALEKSSFVQQALELDNKQRNNYWQQLLIKEGMERLIKEENKWMTYFVGVGQGVASSKITGAAAFFELAEASKAIYDLCCYTENFIKDWSKGLEQNYQGHLNQKLEEQKKIETKQQEEIQKKNTTQTTVHVFAPGIESKGVVPVAKLEEMKDGFTSEQAAAQQLDKTYTAPSNSRTINMEFTKVIGGKLSSDMRNKLVKPVTNAYVSLTVDRVTREASRSLKESMNTYYLEGHMHSLSDQVAKKENKTGKPSTSPEVTTSNDQNQEPKQPLDPLIEKQIKKIQEGKEGDHTSLGAISKKTKRPIYVYDKNGKLHKIIGKELPGAPLHAQHVKNEIGSGHWKIPGDNSKVEESGINNCLYDVCAAQISSKEKDKLGIKSGEDLRQQVANTLLEHPGLTKDLFHISEQLKWRNENALMMGGREYNVNISKNRTPVNKEGNGKYRTEYVSEEGGNDIDYLNYGFYDKKGKFVPIKTEEIARGKEKGSIITIRFTETDKSTVSILLIPGDDKEKDIKGYALEPSGPSTTERDQNKRIPTGTYSLLPHRGTIHKDAFKIFNEDVPMNRDILGHTGNNYTFTKGCLVFGDTWIENEVVKDKNKEIVLDPQKNPIRDNVLSGNWEGEKSPSRLKLDAIKEFCKAKGYKNVKLYIRATDSITEKEKQEKDSKK